MPSLPNSSVLFLSLFFLGLAAWTTQGQQRSADAASDSIRTSRLVIEDDHGRDRIVLLYDEQTEAAVIHLLDSRGRLARSVAVFDDGACQDSWHATRFGKALVLVDVDQTGGSQLIHRSEIGQAALHTQIDEEGKMDTKIHGHE